jgi:hypothetical protein
LLDEARSYRTKIAELSCVNNHLSRHMVQFYNSELSRLEEEIRQVDSSDDWYLLVLISLDVYRLYTGSCDTNRCNVRM